MDLYCRFQKKIDQAVPNATISITSFPTIPHVVEYHIVRHESDTRTMNCKFYKQNKYSVVQRLIYTPLTKKARPTLQAGTSLEVYEETN